jgi:hypothetical protein
MSGEERSLPQASLDRELAVEERAS